MEESIIKYRNAVSTIKQAILQSQYRAAKLVTGEQRYMNRNLRYWICR